MGKQSRRSFIAQVPAAALTAFSEKRPALEASEWTLWYKQPAKIWTEALPVGNGRLGAMVFGGIDDERLQLNEDTLWSGSPRDWNNPRASDALPEIRRLVLDEKRYKEADHVCLGMQGPYNESYQPLGNLHLKFTRLAEAVEYRRELNLDTAIARVRFSAGAVSFTREVFCSAVDQVMVVHISANKAGALNFVVRLDSLLQSRSEALGPNELRLYGKAPARVEPN
jgi:alpha-L-fucosidase 2